MLIFNRCKYIICHICVIGSLLVPTVEANNFRARAHQAVSQKVLPEDIEAEIRFGKKVAARILGREKLFSDKRLTRYINLIGKTLVFHSNRNELDFHFAILDNESINAYSTPGGYVFITKGAIEFAQDEAELAAILAHEIAHITSRHIVKELNIHGTDKSSLSGLASILGATANTSRIALSQTVDKALQLLFDTGFKIEEELEADRIATLLLAETHYDPIALNRFLKRAESIQKSKNKKVITTHPPSADRFNNLANIIKVEKLSSLSYPKLTKRFQSYYKPQAKPGS